jgi:hypothetical protein
MGSADPEHLTGKHINDTGSADDRFHGYRGVAYFI